MFEGVPAILLGVAAFFLMSDRPADAAWLAADARARSTGDPMAFAFLTVQERRRALLPAGVGAAGSRCV